MKNTKLILALFLTLLLPSCRYDTVTAIGEKGSTVYRLDRWTGVMTRINDGVLTLISDSDYDELSFDVSGEESHDLTGTGAKATLNAKWRDGNLYYIAKFSPYSRLRAARDNGGNVIFLLTDSDGYQIATIPLQLSSMTNVVNDSGVKSILSGDGKIQMSRSDFAAMKSWNIAWSFPN